MRKTINRSPFFYVGDKYKLMPQLKELFPNDISIYAEPFVGGGSSFLNTEAKKYIVNDIDENVIGLHKAISDYSDNPDKLFDRLYYLIDKYGLSCSFRGITVPEDLKKQYVKTYYSHYNKDSYLKMRDDYNENHDCIRLYLLLIYGFNHMIRFNSSGEFNLPVGNVDFNNNVHDALVNYLEFFKKNQVIFKNSDYKAFLNGLKTDKKTFVYFDPPYLISGSEYNKMWNEKDDIELCEYIDKLDKKGVKFGITNLVNHKGKFNSFFCEWSKKYLCYSIDSNYISFNDNTIKDSSEEVYVTNYGK